MTVSPRSVGALYSFLGRVIPSMERVGLGENELLFQKATEFIDSHTDFKVCELAKACGMSESALYSFFKSYVGQTPTEIKNKLRIKKAVTLLGSTDLSIEEISDSLEFCTVAYFRKVFISITGKTPTQIRKEQFKKYTL
jgi:AraC-like DNA-binding protein